MSAVAPRWKRFVTQLADDVRMGAPLELLELEPDECVTFCGEESEQSFGHDMLDAISDKYVADAKAQKRLDDLCKKLMQGTMTADELCEYRDIHRAAMIDMCSKWARRLIEEQT